MLKSKYRVLAVTVAVIAVAVFACFALVGLSAETFGAYAAETATNYWKEINIMHWTYGGDNHAPTVVSAYGTPTYKFYKVDEKTGEQMGNAYPNMNAFEIAADNQRVPAGKYAMEATVAATEAYTGLNDKFVFEVAKAVNYWTESPNIAQWAENEAPKYPEAKAKFGDVNFTIRDAGGSVCYQSTGTNQGTYSKKMVAGTYTLTTSVNDGGQNYTGIANYQYEFRVFPEIRNEWTETPYIADYTLAEKPRLHIMGVAKYSDGSQPEVRYWKDGNSQSALPTEEGSWKMVVTVRTEGFVDLVAEVPFNVTKGQNSWTTAPAIKGWTAGEAPSTPAGAAKAGELIFSYSSDGTTWEDTAPTEAGDYVMRAWAYAVGYDDLIVEVPFTVARDESDFKQNSWVTVPNIQGWREGKKANDPVGEAANGTVTFTYKDMNGTRVERPSMAGDYILVATVEAEGYEIMVGEVKFTIAERIVVGDNAGWIAGICVLSAIVAMLIVACVILFIRSKGMTVQQAFRKIFKR